ncbi:hypothetical protein HYT54_01280 [Candidatus Woesearchaeota archaeon]|nr:hypothetical protein [Candidatus Woesearchaeota archaeon]
MPKKETHKYNHVLLNSDDFMDSYEKFGQQIKEAADEFRKLDKKEAIRLISHIDADGISACSLFVKFLNNQNRKYSVSTIQNLDKKVLKELALEPYKCFVFTDLASGLQGQESVHPGPSRA